jgi:trehalose 6-phosphate phosphatase
MRSLWIHWLDLARELASRKNILLLLDFDGTLAPLEASPGLARLPAATKSLIKALRSRPGVKVAVVSGRSVSNIRSHVGLRSIYYAGNHGLEIEGPGLSFRHPRAASLKPALEELSKDLRKDLRRLPGVLVENKGMTLSLHYRLLGPNELKKLGRLLRLYRARTRGLPFRWRAGHKVWEIIPKARWDKGRAALCLLDHLDHPFPVALGDDRTDEDMFRALRGKGITVRIGRRQPSAAEYRLSSQDETQRFLAALEFALAGESR